MKYILIALLISCSELPTKKLPPANYHFNEEITEMEMELRGCKKEIIDDEPFYMCPHKDKK